MNIDPELLKLLQAWSGETLEDLRKTARNSVDPVAYRAVRIGNQRALIVACIVEPGLLKSIKASANCVEIAEWKNISLMEVCTRTIREIPDGQIYTQTAMAGGVTVALAVCGVHPDSVQKVEQMINLPAE